MSAEPDSLEEALYRFLLDETARWPIRKHRNTEEELARIRAEVGQAVDIARQRYMAFMTYKVQAARAP